MNTKPLISLILVSYESSRLLPKFFTALKETEYEPYEVIVVDNASNDGSIAYLEKYQPQTKVIANSINLGFGRACNQGARVAHGDMFVFLNPDVVVTPSWLTFLVEHINKYPDIAIICPQTLYLDEAIGKFDGIYVQEKAAVPGCAMMITRRAWQDLGGFDEFYFLYWEDVEICWRAWLRGWRVAVDLQAYVYHDRGGSVGGKSLHGETTKNCLYTYLKLMRWRKVFPFIIYQVARTFAILLLIPQKGMFSAWSSILVQLPEILSKRRAFAKKVCGNPIDLEHKISEQNQRQRRARQARRHKVMLDAK